LLGMMNLEDVWFIPITFFFSHFSFGDEPP
jgi:hypothetical protein